MINTNLFDENRLEIGEKRKVRVYTDEEKKGKADKIMIPLRVKDKSKIKDISFKNFYLDPSRIYLVRKRYIRAK